MPASVRQAVLPDIDQMLPAYEWLFEAPGRRADCSRSSALMTGKLSPHRAQARMRKRTGMARRTASLEYAAPAGKSGAWIKLV